MKRSIFLSTSLTLSIWYVLLSWDLASGHAPVWLAPAIKELASVQNGTVLLLAALVPLILFWGWVSKVLERMALQRLAEEIKAKRRANRPHGTPTRPDTQDQG